MTKKITLRKIAASLGIAHSTVQRALSGHPNVTPGLREKIARTAGAMGYTLPSHHTRNIAVVISNQHICEYLRTLLNHLLPVLAREGYFASIIAESDMAKVNEFLFDGIISTSWSAKFEKFYPREHVLPVVSLNTGANPAANIYQVTSDESQGVQLAMDYLYKAGHRRIALAVTGAETSFNRNERLAAYQKYCIGKAIAFEDAVYYFENLSLIAKAVKARQFDAVLWTNEGNILEFYAELEKYHIRIPEDFSVIGLESESLSPYLHPPLTAIAQNFSLLAEEAVKMLKQKISKEPVAANIRIPYRLIERESVLKY